MFLEIEDVEVIVQGIRDEDFRFVDRLREKLGNPMHDEAAEPRKLKRYAAATTPSVCRYSNAGKPGIQYGL